MASSGSPEIDSGGLQGDSLPLVGPDDAKLVHAEAIENIAPAYGVHKLPVVGLGGSAGSIAALGSFFESTPAQTGQAYVVVLHLAPGHHSVLPDLLQRHCAMPVRAAEHGALLEADRVYVIPPGKHLTTIDGQLRLTDLQPEHGKRVAVDLFFRSLADTHGPHAIAIVLSGADGDGAIGLKRIKERGGLTIAQDPGEAEHASMPQSAIATGMVDWVLQAAEMPQRIATYRSQAGRLQLPPEEGPPREPTDAERELRLREVLDFVRARTGRDFSDYKRATIVRRIARRMQISGVEDMAGYLDLLRTQSGEAAALAGELLISVTNFFRDRDLFEALQSHLPALFEGKRPEHTVRVWVTACATGEEAYSMAMLLLEQAGELESPPALQVFACDLDEEAIHFARAGFYPETIAGDVSEARLKRFFTKVPNGYLVRRQVREMVLFATHDLLKDAPFSRIDLLSCRNLLIYLGREAQARCLELFNFALKPGGLMFLGSSETVPEGSALFAPLDKRCRIYRQLPAQRIGIPIAQGRGESAVERFVQRRENLPPPAATLPSSAFEVRPRPEPARPPAAPEALPAHELHLRLLGRFGPPSALVNADYDIVHLSENASPFLQLPEGEPTSNLLRLARQALRVGLRSALLAAEERGEPVDVLGREVELAGGPALIDLRVVPAGELAPGHFIVFFAAHGAPRAEGAHGPSAPVDTGSDAVVQQLEQRLARAAVRLRVTIEQYEISTQELKAGNEELQAMNEELRSAGEELESGREEVHSVNEELLTLNTEYRSRVEELSRINSDLHNLMSATQIATVFLDRELRIKRYTPSAVPLFNFIAGDVGRPISDLKRRLDYPQLAADAEQVLQSLVPVEREMRAEARWLLARVLPYRTVEDRIAGVVLTLIDITERRRAEEQLRESQEHLRLIVDNARDFAIFSMDLERRITSWNPGAQAILGYTPQEALVLQGDGIFTPEDRAAGAPRREAETALAVGRASDERWHVRKDGSRFWGSGVMMAMRDGPGTPVGLVKIFRDQTVELHAREAMERARQELHTALRETELARDLAEAAGKTKDRFLAVLSHELRAPLTPVLLGTQVLARNAALPPPVREMLAVVERNVRLQAHLIDDLLDVSRITHGKLELSLAAVDLHVAIARAVEVGHPDLEAKRQGLSVRLDASRHQVQGDAKRLQQVFWNLLKNASKFTPEGGQVTLSSHNEGERVVVEVRDNGVGFAPEAAERIFAVFEQGSRNVTAQYGGLGLGLAIAEASVRAHGGSIRAASEGPGTGASFTVELPLGAEGPA